MTYDESWETEMIRHRRLSTIHVSVSNASSWPERAYRYDAQAIWTRRFVQAAYAAPNREISFLLLVTYGLGLSVGNRRTDLFHQANRAMIGQLYR